MILIFLEVGRKKIVLHFLLGGSGKVEVSSDLSASLPEDRLVIYFRWGDDKMNFARAFEHGDSIVVTYG